MLLLTPLDVGSPQATIIIGTFLSHLFTILVLDNALIFSLPLTTIKRQHCLFAHEGANRAHSSTYSILSSSTSLSR